jgi:hypothetical protein
MLCLLAACLLTYLLCVVACCQQACQNADGCASVQRLYVGDFRKFRVLVVVFAASQTNEQNEHLASHVHLPSRKEVDQVLQFERITVRQFDAEQVDAEQVDAVKTGAACHLNKLRARSRRDVL